VRDYNEDKWLKAYLLGVLQDFEKYPYYAMLEFGSFEYFAQCRMKKNKEVEKQPEKSLSAKELIAKSGSTNLTEGRRFKADINKKECKHEFWYDGGVCKHCQNTVAQLVQLARDKEEPLV